MLQRSQNGYSEEYEEHAFAETPFIVEHEIHESEEEPPWQAPAGEALDGTVGVLNAVSTERDDRNG